MTQEHFLIWFPLNYTGTRPTSVEPGLCDDPLLIVLACREKAMPSRLDFLRIHEELCYPAWCWPLWNIQPFSAHCLHLFAKCSTTLSQFATRLAEALPNLHWIGLIMYFYYRAFVLSACSNALCACKMMILQSCLALLPQGNFKTHIAKVHHIILINYMILFAMRMLDNQWKSDFLNQSSTSILSLAFLRTAKRINGQSDGTCIPKTHPSRVPNGPSHRIQNVCPHHTRGHSVESHHPFAPFFWPPGLLNCV